MLFNTWMGLVRPLIMGVFAYVALIFLLRISGKRTLSKMNMFDFVVTIALGSTFATVILSKNVALAEGIVAFAVLIGLQFVVAWLSVRSLTVRQSVKSEPALLLYRGQFLWSAMKSERVTEEEIRAAVRAQGMASLEEVEAVVLETEGDLSIVRHPQSGDASALEDVVDQKPETHG